jgi:hypothetical protein
LLGCGLMYSLTKLAEYGNEKGYIAFELKYWLVCYCCIFNNK